MADGKIRLSTTARLELRDITHEVEHVVQSESITSGVIHLFNPHTTSGLTF